MEYENDENCGVSDFEYISKNIIKSYEFMEDTNIDDTRSKDILPVKYITNDSGTSSSDINSDQDDILFSTTCNVGKDKNDSTMKEDGEVSSENEETTDNCNPNKKNYIDDTPVKDVHLDGNTAIVNFGTVQTIMKNTVVVKSIPNLNVLDIKSSVFLNDNTHIGEVYDIFGRVEAPFYNIIVKPTVNSLVKPGMKVYYTNNNNLVNFIDLTSISRGDNDNDSEVVI